MRAPFERTQTRSRGRGVGPVTVLLIDCIPTASGGQSAAFFLLFPYLLTSPKDISSAAIFAEHRACARRFPFFLLSLFSCTLVLWPPLTFYGSVVYDTLGKSADFPPAKSSRPRNTLRARSKASQGRSMT